MKEIFFVFYRMWANLKPLNFIFTTTILMILLTVPISIGFEIFEISDPDYGGLDTTKYNTIALILIALVLGPVVEMLIAQFISIILTQNFIENNPNRIGIILSTLIFSGLHIGYSIWYAIAVLPAGLLLAYTFILFQKRKESSFWMTSSVHSLRNFIPLIITISDSHFA